MEAFFTSLFKIIFDKIKDLGVWLVNEYQQYQKALKEEKEIKEDAEKKFKEYESNHSPSNFGKLP